MIGLNKIYNEDCLEGMEKESGITPQSNQDRARERLEQYQRAVRDSRYCQQRIETLREEATSCTPAVGASSAGWTGGEPDEKGGEVKKLDCIFHTMNEKGGLTDTFSPESCEELTGYTFRDIITMYEDYERMVKELEEIQNIGEYERGWAQGRKDTMQAYGIKEVLE